jgi:hypothetical protein
LTLDVGVRRRDGSLLAQFELGIELGDPAGPVDEEIREALSSLDAA